MKSIMGGCGWRTTTGTTTVNGEASTTEYTDFYDCYGSDSSCAFYDHNEDGGGIGDGGETGDGGHGGDVITIGNPWLYINSDSDADILGDALKQALQLNDSLSMKLAQFFQNNGKILVDSTIHFPAEYRRESNTIVVRDISYLQPSAAAVNNAFLIMAHEMGHFTRLFGTSGVIDAGSEEAWASVAAAIELNRSHISVDMGLGTFAMAATMAAHVLRTGGTEQEAHDAVRPYFP